MLKKKSKFSLIEAYKISLQILAKTPENWIEFSAGQNTKTNLARFKDGLFSSLLRQILGYFYFLLKSFSLRQNKVDKKDILFLSSSNNQFTVLNPIFKNEAKFSSAFVIPNYLKFSPSHNCSNDLYFMKISFLYFFPILFLTVTRIPRLSIILWKTDKRLFFLRIKSFLLIYYWLIFHQVLINLIKPKIVMLSNDHNAEMRAMIELCKYFKIKTGYVQHASVSKRFHSLDFDYSFLDGQHALDIYRSCDSRRSLHSTKVSKRRCFLIGNLREFNISRIEIKEPLKIGLALKGTDDIKEVSHIIESLSRVGDVIVRPHPNLKFKKIEGNFKSKFGNKILFSDPKDQSASDFISCINIFVSGNSTLLLEVAAANRNPIYLEELSGGIPDYYGFVKRGVCDCYQNIDEFIDFYKNEKNDYKFVPNKDGINYYWSSYGKTYFNEEAAIVSNLLEKIINNSSDLKSEHHIKEVTL
tara:strand:+ start:17811 stop:19220 length:1410 start_codon:yes stop_codon:yes gene_type:complete